MNYRFVLRQLGLLLVVFSMCMLLITVVEYGLWTIGRAEQLATLSLLVSVGVIALTGGTLWLVGRVGQIERMGRRDAMLLVALSWLVGAAVAGLPYFLWARFSGGAQDGHPFASFVACYFEAMSGLTTTGASVLHDAPHDIESMPRALLLWRSMTQWLGGLGIVVLFVAVLPTLGVGGKRLYQVEAPGPTQQGVRPRIKETARYLWMIYLGLTVLFAVAYRLAGMDWFDAVNHTFTALATGGFSTRNASVGAYQSIPINLITIVAMFVAGVNFALYYRVLVRRQIRVVLADPEFRLYGAIILVSVGLVFVSIVGRETIHLAGHRVLAGPWFALEHSVFQVITIMTTTGFASVDFDQWSFLPKAILVMLMFVGGCAGSTGGGIKVIRVLMVGKILFAELERVFRPSVVRTVRIGKGSIDPSGRQSVLAYVLIVLALFAAGTVAIKLAESGQDLSITTAATAAAATLHNIGPGLELVGPAGNYSRFGGPSLLIMSMLMALGRLEVFALAVLVLPRFWTGE